MTAFLVSHQRLRLLCWLALGFLLGRFVLARAQARLHAGHERRVRLLNAQTGQGRHLNAMEQALGLDPRFPVRHRSKTAAVIREIAAVAFDDLGPCP
jgi:hypothetical protein